MRGGGPELSPNAFSDDSFHSLRWRYRDSPSPPWARGGAGDAPGREREGCSQVEQVLSRRWAPSAVLRAGLTLGPALRLLLFRLPPLLPQRIHRQSNSENVAYHARRAGHVPVRSAATAHSGPLWTLRSPAVPKSLTLLDPALPISQMYLTVEFFFFFSF